MASIPFQIFPGFAVPFAQTSMPDSQELNGRLRALFLEREAEGAAYANTSPTMRIGPGLFESRFDLFHWDHPDIRQLQEFCTATVFRLIAELSGYDRERVQALRMSADAWFHITRAGGSFGFHNHPMASWSGIYCVDNGYGDNAGVDSGHVQFMHPAPTAGMFVDLGVANVRAPWANQPKEMALMSGQLVVFPSWVMHQVLPFTGTQERVTVAFNAWFKDVGAGAAT
ncbi:putative 2OG-Fe(II) oxygenase [Abyssibacter sp.]|uniref:putative 2OG-Fe(II) oxygenase n=1 Tax=Abyssibacter sp. TaxID=2320200 RepID=UPI0025BB0849|nr:putative 2OG-Fe(II) oxygenase [Abyssibacter sp.]MCK5860368.1 hypothetical protein [Abyssibacter sp.]